MILPEGVGNREWLAKRLFPCYSVALITCHLSLRNLRYHMPTCIYRDPLADCTSKNSSSKHEELSESISEAARDTLERKISCCLPDSSSWVASSPSQWTLYVKQNAFTQEELGILCGLSSSLHPRNVNTTWIGTNQTWQPRLETKVGLI